MAKPPTSPPPPPPGPQAPPDPRSHEGAPPPPLVAPRFPTRDLDDPTGVAGLTRAATDHAASLRAYDELVRVARDPYADPAMPHILAALEAAEPALRAACSHAAAAAARAEDHAERVRALPMDDLLVIGAAAVAEERAAAADAAWREAYAEWARVHACLPRPAKGPSDRTIS